MTLVTEAAAFAARAHEGQVRKGTNIPYIVHPMEAAAIVAALTDEPELIAAALLHDVMEDCGVTYAQLCERFGPRVAKIVREDSQCQSTASGERAPWGVRKRAAVERFRSSDRDEKLIVLADKLSNMRAMFRDFEREGAAMFAKFNERDMRRHAWYYRSCAALTEAEFGSTGAWRELSWRIEYVFAGVDSVAPDGACAQAKD
jgi:myo-inositol-1(or 4)-monophosphatase